MRVIIQVLYQFCSQLGQILRWPKFENIHIQGLNDYKWKYMLSAMPEIPNLIENNSKYHPYLVNIATNCH